MDKTKKIERIIFVKDQKGACIFFEDNTVKLVSREEGKEATMLLLKQDKVENLDLDNYNKIEFLNCVDLYRKYGNEINKRKLTERKSKKDTSTYSHDEKEEKDRSKKFKMVNSIVTAGIILSLGSLAIGGYNIFNNLFGDKQITNDNDNDIDNNNDTVDNYIESNNMMNILNNAEINETRRKFLLSVFNYLCDYNNDFSYQHTDNTTDTKIAIKWDEVVSQLLVYNKYDKQQIFDIFGYYDYDSSEMYKAYKEGQKQEKMAYIIQKVPLEKPFLNEEEYNLYEKYESLNIKFNNQTTQEDKINVAKIFFREIRNDIDFEEGKISEKMIVISPILEAMMKKTHNSKLEERLNSKELEFYRSYCDEKIREKLQKRGNQLEEVTNSNRNLGITETYTYQQIKDVAIKQLEESNFYNVADDQRNISDHEDYKKASSYFKDYNSKKEQDSDFSEYYSNNYEENTSNEENKNSSENNKKYKINSSLISDKITTKKEEKKVTSNNKSSNDDINNNSYIDNEQNNDNNNSEYDNSYIDNNNDIQQDENSNYEDNNESIDYEETTENENNNNSSSIYEDYIKDITTDPSGAVDHDEPLPDPNSISVYNINIEEIADKAIEYLFEINTPEPTEANKVLIK